MRGSPSIGDSLPAGVSAQTAVKTLSGWSGEIRGEIAVKLSLAALPLRTRPDFETSRVLCGLAQNSAHSELTPNFAAQAAANIETCSAQLTSVLSYAMASEAKPASKAIARLMLEVNPLRCAFWTHFI
ncbi:hypothetical protein ACFQHW_04610 [Lapidilactobacillus achengensis]|uniref:Uncharacterized protein n=1 Tax=Lapidilactobacillus achengensis TaxID=2486000 RepID=A0ABW1UP57_9LACO|nr:hypothetical protein [Lapidilactobacillus achengensis]